VRIALTVLLAAVALAGCAGDDEAASKRPSTGSDTGSVTAAEPTPPGQGAQTRAPHVASRSALQRIRAIEEKFSVVEDRLGEGILAVSGFDSNVRCWTRPGWRRLAAIHGVRPDELAGVADIFALEIHLHPFVCERLEALLAGEQPQVGPEALLTAGALVTLAHEGMHLTAVGSNEAAAECRAMQNADEVAERLGVDVEYGSRLALIYWEELYRPDDPVYGSPECRDGGSLDINPDTSLWP
jgi:hypothetical protein